MDLPDPGSVFLTQSWKFTRPVFIGDTITARAEVLHVHDTEPVVRLPRRLVRDARVRAAVIWAGVRASLLLLGLMAGPDVPLLRPVAFAWVVLLSTFLVQLDVRVCRETVLFANLGVGSGRIAWIALPVVLALEAGCQLVLLLIIAS